MIIVLPSIENCSSFLRGNSSGSARPDLVSLKGRRLVVGKEVAKTETLNIGVLKELTGNDSINARDLFQTW